MSTGRSRRPPILYVQCRTYGHAWDESNEEIPAPTFSWWQRLLLRCTRCTTTLLHTRTDGTMLLLDEAEAIWALRKVDV